MMSTRIHRACTVRAILAIACTGLAGLAGAQPEPQPIADSMPAEIARRVAEQRAQEHQAAAKLATVVSNYAITNRRWETGSTVLVAFNGGTSDLHAAIARVAGEWSKYANVKLDFGLDASTGKYRSWTPQDASYAAHIRIGFDQPGYYSALGTDSVNQNPFGPGVQSMNFRGFDVRWPATMPAGWERVVRHEFGHALGFNHEHQQKSCFNAIKWVGTPNVYDAYLAWQGWDRSMVDSQLGMLGSSAGVSLSSQLDRLSVMFYAIPADALIDGIKSACYIKQENNLISQLDKQGAGLAYPFAAGTLSSHLPSTAVLKESLANMGQQLTVAESSAFSARAAALIQARVPLVYIQIGSEEDRALARRIQSGVLGLGFLAPGIENVKNKAAVPAVTQIRYFRPADEEHAQAVAAQIRAENPDIQPVVIKVGGNIAKTVNRNLVEVWIGRG